MADKSDAFDFEALATRVVREYANTDGGHPLLSLLHLLGDATLPLTAEDRAAIMRGAAAAAAEWDGRSKSAKREYGMVKATLAGFAQRGGVAHG
jgi:hypothetical protein